MKKTFQIPVISNNRIYGNSNHNYCTSDQDHASLLNQNPNLNQETNALKPCKYNKGLMLLNVISQVPKKRILVLKTCFSTTETIPE